MRIKINFILLFFHHLLHHCFYNCFTVVYSIDNYFFLLCTIADYGVTIMNLKLKAMLHALLKKKIFNKLLWSKFKKVIGNFL